MCLRHAFTRQTLTFGTVAERKGNRLIIEGQGSGLRGKQPGVGSIPALRELIIVPKPPVLARGRLSNNDLLEPSGYGTAA